VKRTLINATLIFLMIVKLFAIECEGRGWKGVDATGSIHANTPADIKCIAEGVYATYAIVMCNRCRLDI
jgi:hypothetical protein